MRFRRWWIASALLVPPILLASGWTSVEPGEVVVVRRFGRVLPAPWQPGWHWSFPLGIDRKDRLRVDEIRRLEFGRVDVAGPKEDPSEGEFLTGDGNLVRVRGVVQYRVLDPSSYLLRSNEVDRLLGRSVESSLASVLASRGIDDALRSGRSEVGGAILQGLSESVDRLSLGVAILGVNLTDARPPVEVEPAFEEAQAAQSARARRINEARALLDAIRPAAVAEAQGAIDQARAQADRGLATSRSQADRFLALLAEANRSRPLTVRRLYRDALRDLLPKVRRKVLMTPNEPVDLNLIGPGPR